MDVEALIKFYGRFRFEYTPRHLLSVCINYTGFPTKDEKPIVLEIIGSEG